MCHGCHACQSGLRAHVQRAKAASIFQLGLPACQRRANYSIWRAKKPKGVPVFQLFFKRKYFFNFKIFQSWLTFANFKNIWAILENLSHETKNSNFAISKISLRKNLVNLNTLTSFSMEHIGLTQQLFGWCERELNIYIFYLPNSICSV